MRKGNVSIFLVMLSALFLVSGNTSDHPFYVSVTELKLDTRKHVLTASCRMFTDDLESALTRIFKRPFDLLKQENDAEVNALLNRYIQERFSVGLEGQLLQFSFLGFEREEEATWCYLEAVDCKSGKGMTVSNSLLYDFLPLQEHVIHLYVDGKRQSTRLVNPERSAAFFW
jgi:hypothetical protein